MDTAYNLQFEKLCKNFGLGELSAEPERIYGGHLHRMYKVITANEGKYAVKALNPQIMLRPEAKPGIIESEHIAQIVARHVPAAPAKVFDGILMPEVEGQFYLIFDWIDGIPKYSVDITVHHCRMIGGLLADIHKTDFSNLGLKHNIKISKPTDWNLYLSKGKNIAASWTEIFDRHIDNIYAWNDRLIRASRLLTHGNVISHRDLEPKNVLWCGDDPVIIDWEAAGYIYPMHDLVETALYWSSGPQGQHDKEKFTAFVSGYADKIDIFEEDWHAILDKGFASNLGWLEYSLKRSLGIQCTDDEERRIGTEQVTATISALQKYDRMQATILEWLREFEV